MGTIFFLILFPLLVALVLLIVKADKARDTVVIAASVIIAAVSIYCAATYLGDGTTYFDFSSEIVNYIMMIIECGVAIIITVLLVASMFSYKHFAKKKLSPTLLIVISAVMGIVIYGI